MTNRLIPISNPKFGFAERRAVSRVLRSGMVAQGPQVAHFEAEFSNLVLQRHCVAVNSGTSGLHLSLLALGIGPGDEVVVPSFTFAATANAVALVGATPVFVDVNPRNYCIDPVAVESAISPRTAAVIPVHLYGHPAPMPELRRICDRHDLALIEDAAQAHMASLGGFPVGTFGDLAVFSFYPTKNMSSGEGGMVVTDQEQIAEKLRMLRNQGMLARYQNELVGLNNRMTDIHAAIGRIQLRKLRSWTNARVRNAQLLSSGLEGVSVPTVAEGTSHAFHQYTVRIQFGRDSLAKFLLEEWRIETGVYYPIPCHELPALRKLGRTTDLDETLRLSKEVLSLPVHPGLSRHDISRIQKGVSAYVNKGTG